MASMSKAGSPVTWRCSLISLTAVWMTVSV
jgi:hypothetical protein